MTTTERRAWSLLATRLGSVLLLSLVTWALLRGFAGVDAFPPNTVWATLALLPVNVMCLVLVRRMYRTEGITLRAALGIPSRADAPSGARAARVLKDVFWGILWLVVLNVPFALAVAAVVFALYGADAPAAFATIFFDESSAVTMDPIPLLVLSIVAVVPFMVLNAPTEELVFRGYALSGIARGRGARAAALLTALAFGAQHVLFAATVPGMLVYFVAFTVWGLIAAVIVRRQGRLLPVVVAHWIVNLTMSSPALVFPILDLAGPAARG